jgi:hypothetical protein
MDTQLASSAGKTTSRILAGIIAGVLILIVGVVAWNLTRVGTITNFSDCAAKYPVMDSFPEQCRTPDGRIFVNQK